VFSANNDHRMPLTAATKAASDNSKEGSSTSLSRAAIGGVVRLSAFLFDLTVASGTEYPLRPKMFYGSINQFRKDANAT